MPNRILRDITDSETVNSLSFQAEVLMYRLFMKADDYGSFHANPKLIRSALFPLKDNIRETDITRWLDELQSSGLIFFYEVGNKKFLRVINFGQRLRNMRNSFPAPAVNSQQVAAIRSDSPPEEKRNETETESEEKVFITPDLSNSNLYRQPNIPKIEMVEEIFIRKGGTKEMAKRFFTKHNSVGWFLNSSPIINFSSLVPGYIENWKKNENGKVKESVTDSQLERINNKLKYGN